MIYGDSKNFPISNLTINGKWYSVADIELRQRTLLKYYLTFDERGKNSEFDEPTDPILPYDLVVNAIDIEDVCRRIIKNYDLFYAIEK